jgi:hypothetical protein
MPLSRKVRAGCKAGVARIWLRISGEALTSTQSSPFSLTAIDDCVRLVARMLPLRTPRQLKQLQFHCGKPPPAAEPSMRIFNAGSRRRATSSSAYDRMRSGWIPFNIAMRTTSAIGDVHRDFKTEAEGRGLRGFPGHHRLL